MSFGWSSGDIIASLSFSREVYDALTSSTEEYQDFKSFLRTLDANLDLILSWTTPDNGNENPRFTADEANILNEVIMNLQKSVLRFESALKKYMRLDQKPSSMPIIDQMKRQGDKLRWHFLTETDVKKRKEEVMGYLTQLNTVSHNHNIRAHQSLSLKLDRVTFKQDQTFAICTELRTLVTDIVLVMGEIPAARPMPMPLDAKPMIETGTAQHESEITALVAKLQPYGIESAFSKGFSSRSSEISTLRMDSATTRVVGAWLGSAETISSGSSSSSPRSLWLCESYATILSKVIMRVSHDLELPVVYYRCRRLDANGDDIASPTMLLALCYCYLSQLLGYLITDATNPKTLALILECDAIKQLDGTLTSIRAAVTLIQHIVDTVLPSSYRAILIIEDFNLLVRSVKLDSDLSHASSDTYPSVLRDFLALILHRDYITSLIEKSSSIRTLLTTSGPSGFLIDAMQRRQITRLSTNKTLKRGRFKCADEVRALLVSYSG